MRALPGHLKGIMERLFKTIELRIVFLKNTGFQTGGI